MAGERLLEEIPWRLEVLTPLHAGSGEQLTKGLDVETADGWTYAVDLDKLLTKLPPSGWSSVGVVELAQLYPGGSLRDVARYAMPGPLGGPGFGSEHGRPTILRCFARDAFGRAYLPGSTLKGALRTALLAQIVEDDAAVQKALRDVAARRGTRTGKDADTHVQRAAFRIGGSDRVVDDVLRHLHVPDVPVPPGAVEVVDVKIKSMNMGEGWNEKTWPTFVEAVRVGTVLRVPLRVDARRLHETKGQDFSRWKKYLLGGGLLAAVRAHGERLLGPEVALWTRSRALDAAGREAARLAARAKDGEAVFPVAWGIGWRGMTGGALERLDGNGARAGDAGIEDPRALAAARRNHPAMGGKQGVPIFPKSRRLAVKDGAAAMPMGWMAARAWAEGDEVTVFAAVEAKEGRLPRGATTAPARRVGAVAVVEARAKRGDRVRGRLVGKSGKGKWKVEVEWYAGGGVVVGGEEPTNAAVGMEVELVVRNAAVGGQPWDLEWGKKG